MHKITVNNTPSDLKVFTNGKPRILLIPKEQLELLAKAPEQQMNGYYKNMDWKGV